jgi:sensor histidine kinase YesM
VIVGWTLVWLFFSQRLYYAYQMSEHPITWGQALTWSFLDWSLWAALSPLIFRWSRRWGLVRANRVRNFLRHFGLSVLLATLHTLVYGTAVWIAKPVPQENLSIPTFAKLLLMGKFHIGVITYWVLVLLRYSLDYYRRYRREELRVSRIETQLAQAELQALRMQVHPHFLFNTLNAISALMHRDVEAAERMLARLSDFLRLTLETNGLQEVSLRQELDFLRRYLEIEQTRFADRLRVEMNIDPGTLDARVPNLILQPLVENAIRHGIAPSSSAGTVAIAAHRENGTLRLEVRDDGPGLPEGSPVPHREGVGLSNTRARLHQLYGNASRLDLTNARSGGLIVSVDIPFRSAASGTDAGEGRGA